MPAILKDILCSYINDINTIYLFTNENGHLMSESQYRKLWQGIHNKINLQMGGTVSKRTRKGTLKGIDAIIGLTPHTFRHNYATMLYYAGIDVKEAQKLLGHANIKVTLEIYTHLDEEKSNVSDKLNSFIAL
jgi:integrase